MFQFAQVTGRVISRERDVCGPEYSALHRSGDLSLAAPIQYWVTLQVGEEERLVSVAKDDYEAAEEGSVVTVIDIAVLRFGLVILLIVFGGIALVAVMLILTIF